MNTPPSSQAGEQAANSPARERVIRRFPNQFADLLSRNGRAVLSGRRRREGRFFAGRGLIDPARARACLALLERAFPDVLGRIDEPIPLDATWGLTENYAERLPKTARVSTAMLESRRSRAYRRAEETGLVAMLRSESFHAFAEALNGSPLRKRWGIQLLCYGPGDYAGPHTDHHPEDDEAREGYLDVHLSFSNAGVTRQLLVSERRGHFSEVVDVAANGLVTAYRLPFWHYTTPLQGRRGSRRWVLLGTFLDAAA